MWSSGPANKNTLVYLHGMRADQMMIKCSHTEGCKPHFLAWVEHMVALSLSLYLYFFSKRLIDWICWMYVLAWGLWKCSVLQSFGAWNWQERDASMCWTSQMGMSGTGTSIWIIGRLCWSWAGWEAMVCLAGHIYTRYNSLKSFYFSHCAQLWLCLHLKLLQNNVENMNKHMHPELLIQVKLFTTESEGKQNYYSQSVRNIHHTLLPRLLAPSLTSCTHCS